MLFRSEGLGWIDAVVRRIAPADPALRVPHVGWNEIHVARPSVLLQELPEQPLFYFVHSFAAPVGAHSLAVSDYGNEFTAVARRGNFRGAQFHPERSARTGATLLANFLKIT